MNDMTQTEADPSAPSHRPAPLAPATWNPTARTVEATLATVTPVPREHWDGSRVLEILEITPAAIDMSRLESGIPLLDSHQSDGVANIVGSTVAGSARIERGQLVATLEIARTPEGDHAAKLIEDGHLTSVSIGYVVNETIDEVAPEGSGVERVVRVTSWEPVEVSLVAIPADPHARMRAHAPVARTVSAAVMARRLAAWPRHIQEEIVSMHRAKPLTESELIAELSRRHVEGQAPVGIRSPIAITRDEGDTVRAGIEGALLHRMRGGHVAPNDPSREYVGRSLLDMVRSLAEAAGHRGARRASPIELATRFMVTSDFPGLLANAAGKHLVNTFRAQQSPLRTICTEKMVRDFKEQSFLIVDGPSSLPLLPEGGEIRESAIVEGKQSGRLRTWANSFTLSRQAIVNDDLSAFDGALNFLAKAAAMTEGQEISALLAANTGNGPTLGDGQPMFAVARGNRPASGSALTVPNLGTARAAMRTQRALDGVNPIGAAPAYLVVGPSLETTAEQILAELQPTTVGEANPFSGRMELVVDSRQAGNGWRLFAAKDIWPVLVFMTLEGQPAAPVIDGVPEANRDGFFFRVVHDFGVAVADWRGSWFNPGA